MVEAAGGCLGRQLPNVREEGFPVVGVARHGGVGQRPAAVELLVRVRIGVGARVGVRVRVRVRVRVGLGLELGLGSGLGSGSGSGLAFTMLLY